MPQKKSFSALKPVARFILLFFILLLVFALIFGYFRSHYPKVVTDYLVFTTSVVKAFLSLIGLKIRAGGTSIFSDKFAIEVILECAGVYQALVFSAAVLAFPADVKKKIWGILIAVPLFYIIDILRISTMFLIGSYKPAWFGFFHLYTGQMIVIFLVIFFWIIWLKKMALNERKSA